MSFNWKSPKTWVWVRGYCVDQTNRNKVLLLLEPLDEMGNMLVEADRSSAARLHLRISSDVAMQMEYDLPEVEGVMMVKIPKEFPHDKIKVILTKLRCNMDARILWWDGHVGPVKSGNRS